ncbi:hypothetical protein GGI23_000106 [Coemansia sp. RSA 2559]|nr:hypothetical protein GGI23_000106 [Coemansia sp. RSA 2559]KAJ2869496.1 hypothetical protein GGI22_000213 [Coemansia erecta]
MAAAAMETPSALTGVQQTFTPSIDIQGSKKLELQIELHEAPAVIRRRSTDQNQDLVVRGHIIVICRDAQRMDGQIKATFVGTKHLENIQQMGSVGSQKKVIVKQELLLDLDQEAADGHYAIGTYRVPFEFALTSKGKLQPSISVPRCTVEYVMTASVAKKSSSYLKLLLPLVGGSTAKAQCIVPVINAPADNEGGNGQADQPAHVGPITRVGTLGSGTSGTGKLPYRIAMDRNVAMAGDVIGFTLEVYPPDQTPDFSPAEFAALSKIAAAAASTDNSLNNTDLSDAASASSNGDDGQTISLSSPPTYQPTGADLAGNKLTVTAYKVRAKLVQSVCYMTDHDLVADANDGVYLFWTKRTMAATLVAHSLDLSKAASGNERVKAEWVLPVPEQMQPDVHTPDIQVRYDVFVDFYPRSGGGSSSSSKGSALKGMVLRANNRRLSSKLPLRTVLPPASVSLAPNPPSYQI